ncbi:MAG TPA: M48 family metalloprotease [Kofleriaceae bacterium]|nr:M48 family metalloprotease [Kofleriaceae bacterium]
MSRSPRAHAARFAAAIACAAWAACAGPSYLGAQLPNPCLAHDIEGCLGWMVERDLAEAELDLYDDGALRDYVQGIAERLAQVSSLAAAPRIVIADRDGTYATSGSRIVLGRTTIERLDSEAELAGVVAHELAHIEGHHAQVSLFGPPPDDDRLVLRRDAEAIADERAVALLERAGYTPGAMARALRAVLDSDDDEHPLRADRIARASVMAGARPGYEGRAELLAHLEHMVVGRDPRLGRRVGAAWVIAALGLALDLGDGDLVREADHVLVLRRADATLAAYAIGAPWGREIAAALDDRASDDRGLGRVTVGTVAQPAERETSPLARLARAVRSSLPQPAVGTRVAIIERSRGALVVELGGRGWSPHRLDLGLREATIQELAAAEPTRIVIERAYRAGPIAQSLACEGRLLDSVDRRVDAGEPIKCADRQPGSRELSLGGAGGAQLRW